MRNYEILTKRHQHDYLEDINLDDIEFKTFTYQELQSFFLINYVDDSQTIVGWSVDGFLHPLGMKYLEFSIPCKDNFYVVGLAKNKKGKKTIVFCMEYNDNYQIELEEEKRIAYVTYIETNHYFKKRGIFNKSLEYIKQQFKKYDMLITTSMSDEGLEVNIYEKIVETFKDTRVEIKTEDDCYILKRKK